MAKLRKELIQRLQRIPGLEDRPSKVAGGSAIFYKDKEIAHFYDDNEIDVRLTKKVIRKEGLNHPDDSKIHKHRSPNSDWIEIKFILSELEGAIWKFPVEMKNGEHQLKAGLHFTETLQ